MWISETILLAKATIPHEPTITLTQPPDHINIKRKHREKGLCHFLCASFLFNQRSSVHAYQDQTDATALPKLSTVI